MKFNYLYIVITALIIVTSCKKDDQIEPFDHVGQAVLDDETLQTFLETHYYTPPTSMQRFGDVNLIENGETPLMSQVTIQDVTQNDIAYKIYVLKNLPIGVGESPSKVDSALVNYKGLLLDEAKTVFDEKETFFWANLFSGVIPGWTYAIPNFEAGVNLSQPDQPLNFNQMGKGVFFLPSGLAYRNLGSSSIGANAPLMFHIEMAMIKRSDQDLDGILSIYEDLNNDAIFINDDTDNDERYNFLDVDDDNDTILTKYENADMNEDGNPNDAQDTDGDNTPDYLDNDDDGDGILTKDENADPNADGNPYDAKDSDGDNTPDYLDGN